jgi:hypothetical protein
MWGTTNSKARNQKNRREQQVNTLCADAHFFPAPRTSPPETLCNYAEPQPIS